ncbi:hypothetical protein [Stappia indica]|uniref:hypothetical protein n=1 Tax=Stappia indica TaxID=538381 RepID=UPI001CD46ADF|nr:hypothetical protein [Stappia indica]MCA1300568.1 hypothetical protein [Stappia indica]
MGVDKKDDQPAVNTNQKDGDEILKRMLKTPPDQKKKEEGGYGRDSTDQSRSMPNDSKNFEPD